MDLRARAVAAELQALGAQDERVLIAYPGNLDYVVSFLGCLYAGAVAVTCDAPQRRSGVERLAVVAADARPRVVLCPASDDRAVQAAGGRDAVRHLDVAAVPDAAAGGWREPRPDLEALALLQYTSGSTQAPRGVMVSHGNVMSNEHAVAVAMRHSQDTVIASWLPLFHDMGLMAVVLQALYLGSTSVFMPPLAFLEKPVRWLRAVSRYQAHTIGAPNFAYDLCSARIAPDDRAQLDLSSLRVAFNGAEMVRPATMRRFSETFAPVGFRPEAFLPCYGLAEATLIVSGAASDRPPVTVRADPAQLRGGRIVAAPDGGTSRSLACCGPAVADTTIAIVDPETGEEVPPGTLGEVWVRGPGVSSGYWKRPEDNEHTFRARLGDAGPFLRTGDLGSLVGGQLVLSGRIKDMIVLHGQNHYPHDLEWTAEASHPALRRTCGAAFAIESDDEEQLVIVYEVTEGAAGAAGAAGADGPDGAAVDVEDVAKSIRTAVSERHEVDVHAVALVRRASVPKTTSGKIRRRACKDLFLSGRLPLVGVSWRQVSGRGVVGLPDPAELAGLDQADGTSALAVALLHAAATRYGIAAGTLQVTDPVSSLGLDSLSATELQYALQDRYGVTLPPLAMLSGLTFTEVAGQVCTLLLAGNSIPADAIPADTVAADAIPADAIPADTGRP